MTKELKVLVVEDHPLFMHGLQQMITSLCDDVDIHEATTGEAALQLVDQHPFLDWIFLDLQLPDMSGIEILQKFKAMLITTPILVISSVSDMRVIDKLMTLGASGFLPKSADQQDIKRALTAIESSGYFLPNEFATQLQEYRQTVKTQSTLVKSHLTKRQHEILVLMSQGYSNQEIGNSLSISESTVKGHVSTLLTLLDVDNRTHCVAETQRLGLLDELL